MASDDALLDRFQRVAFDFFPEFGDPANGLIADSSAPGAPASIAVVGFGLACYPVGVERGWMTRGDAAARTLAALRFLLAGPQGGGPGATGHRGFHYHFLDRTSGLRAWESELSPIDTALLMAGVLTARAYFAADSADEADIRALADALFLRVEWSWAWNGKPTARQSWKPRGGFARRGWDGYSEALLLYVLAMASPSHPPPDDGFPAWTDTFQWSNVRGVAHLHAGPLFIHQFPHAFLDTRGIRDAFMRGRDSDYFENSRRAVRVQRDYARRNPRGFAGYGENAWGFTAGEGPGDGAVIAGGRTRRTRGYAARGVPYGPDDGTLSPAAVLASLPFAPDAVMPAIRHLLSRYPEVFRGMALPSGFNPTLPGEGAAGWVCDRRLGLDQGIVVLMIENCRSGLIWDLTRRCPHIRRGLERAGFTGGWLS